MLKRENKKGWLHAYKKITEDFGVDYSNCPVKFEIIEQLVLARNRTQHEEDITSNYVKHCENDLFPAVPDIPSRPVFRGYERIGFRKLFGAIA